jgi:hypothetical protein
MKTNDQFWISLRELVDTYNDKGMTPSERAEAIGAELQDLAPLARWQCLDDLSVTVDNFQVLYDFIRSQRQEKDGERVIGTRHG